ncbi:RHS repeat-associated core domain-containing protein [Cedecea davisae]|nr:RHS repeat-associated core domain-containing protein [Cedecea davisae]
MTFMTTNLTRYIRSGHASLGVARAAGLTLIGNGHNASPLWSRNAASGPGQLHTWSPWGSGNPAEGLPGFNGERIDPVSGNYHLGNGYRAYNPVLGRFNCPDSLSPFGAGGINPYVYCGGDPVNYTDPTGHISWQSILGIIFGIIGLGLSLFTAGLSIAAAGGISAALSSASATTLALGGLGVLADVTAIASGATEDVNPEASSVLGWVSMATGVAGMAVGSRLAYSKAGALKELDFMHLNNKKNPSLKGGFFNKKSLSRMNSPALLTKESNYFKVVDSYPDSSFNIPRAKLMPAGSNVRKINSRIAKELGRDPAGVIEGIQKQDEIKNVRFDDHVSVIIFDSTYGGLKIENESVVSNEIYDAGIAHVGNKANSDFDFSDFYNLHNII